MLIWVIFAVMTAAVAAALLRPLARNHPEYDHSQHSPDAAIYRDQLAEIDADLSRGLISASEAEAARIEVSRRLLATDNSMLSGKMSEPRKPIPQSAIIASAALFTGVAVAAYLVRGAPWLESQPHSSRVADKPGGATRIADLIAMVENRLRSHPEDGQGWSVIAPVYMRHGRHAEAASAYANALRLLGETPDRLAGFAQATILANDGVVTEPARKAYEKVLAAVPGAPEPRFWLAMAKEQDGRITDAARDFEALLAEASADARWRPLVESRLAALQKKMGTTPAHKTPGPTPGDLAAADKLDASERQAMIEQMVAGLAARLKQNGGDLEGWKKLVQSYMVLGQRDKALAALADARKAMASDAENLARMDAWAKDIGLQS